MELFGLVVDMAYPDLPVPEALRRAAERNLVLSLREVCDRAWDYGIEEGGPLVCGPGLLHVHVGNCVLEPSSPLYGDKHPRFGVEGGANACVRYCCAIRNPFYRSLRCVS